MNEDVSSKLAGVREAAGILVLAVEASVLKKIVEVEGHLSKCQEISQGYGLKDENDWKAGITDPNNLEEVIKCANDTLDNVDGSALGNQLESYRQARVHQSLSLV